MSNHSSARPHTIKSTNNNALCRQEAGADGSSSRQEAVAGGSSTTNVIKRRAQSLIKNKSIDAQSRAIIRYALETNDPWLPKLVRRADAGEPIIDGAGRLIIETGAKEVCK